MSNENACITQELIDNARLFVDAQISTNNGKDAVADDWYIKHEYHAVKDLADKFFSQWEHVPIWVTTHQDDSRCYHFDADGNIVRGGHWVVWIDGYGIDRYVNRYPVSFYHIITEAIMLRKNYDQVTLKLWNDETDSFYSQDECPETEWAKRIGHSLYSDQVNAHRVFGYGVNDFPDAIATDEDEFRNMCIYINNHKELWEHNYSMAFSHAPIVSKSNAAFCMMLEVLLNKGDELAECLHDMFMAQVKDPTVWREIKKTANKVVQLSVEED